jgi:peroxiredoxin Q/BCP
MKRTALLAAALVLAGVSATNAQTPPPAPAKSLEVGTVAPDFEMQAATRYGELGAPIHLSDFKGKTVVMAFFPKARTRGCTIQMRSYRDQYDKLFHTGQNIVLIGISADSPEDLASWAKDDQFQFVMASDKDLKVSSVYGARAAQGNITNRNLFVIGPDGKIVYTALPFREVDPTSYTTLADVLNKTLPTPAGN